MGIEPTLQTLAKCSNHRATANSSDERLICWTASSLLFFFAKLLHAKPKDASGKAASRGKRGLKPEKKSLNPLL